MRWKIVIGFLSVSFILIEPVAIAMFVGPYALMFHLANIIAIGSLTYWLGSRQKQKLIFDINQEITKAFLPPLMDGIGDTIRAAFGSIARSFGKGTNFGYKVGTITKEPEITREQFIAELESMELPEFKGVKGAARREDLQEFSEEEKRKLRLSNNVF